MKVTVVLLAWLESLGGKNIDLELCEGATVSEALRSLSLHELEYAATILNFEQADENQTLADGDILYIFPAIAGG